MAREYFCPICGEKMARKLLGYDHYPYLVCEVGEMTLSRVTQNFVERRFEEVQEVPVPAREAYEAGKDHWYCLGCGGDLNGEFGCELCGKNIRDIMVQIIDRLPHL